MSIPDNLEIEWYINGKIKSISEVNNTGQLHGIYVTWDDDDGKLHEYIEYANGKRNGKYQRWYYNGSPFVDAVFKDEKAHGMYRVWTETGRLPTVHFIYDGENITDQIKKIVKNLHNITDIEKSYIALQYGFCL